MGWVEKDHEGNVTVHAPAANTRGPIPPKAYLDTNLVSGLGRADIKAEEYQALHQVIELMHEGRIALVTSAVTKEEIDRVPLEHRAPHEAIYALLAKVPVVDEQRLVPRIIQAIRGRSQVIGPLVVQEEDLGTLNSILPDQNDARHVFQALRNSSQYFVTTDRRTILTRAKQIEAAFPIRVVLPSQLLAELTAVKAS
jgi:predicted nucleic acid-binding protein